MQTFAGILLHKAKILNCKGWRAWCISCSAEVRCHSLKPYPAELGESPRMELPPSPCWASVSRQCWPQGEHFFP